MFNLCADCDYGELSDNVKHDVQSAPSPAAHYQDEDRLEQDNRVQNRRRTKVKGRLMVVLTSSDPGLLFFRKSGCVQVSNGTSFIHVVHTVDYLGVDRN